ncbi:DUF6168 family protein [Croceivirga thetidis]|uniref:ATP synthase protein I2 n=1 Tax=Croceivirga thetidis TaxID=2721623 RepID=A0ABX1GMM9_9FLAO|nr:DUF6168 family protein [Croceivirga thetidis]NKI31171.1 hypothetical protein [Croceivirga thetidis]
MARLPLIFLGVLMLSLLVAFGLHLFALQSNNLPLWDNLIATSYVINFILAALIFLIIYFLKDRLSNAMGFLFMAGSLLKFLVFFLVFYPVYKSDGVTDKLEISAFLIPYLIALVLETFYASKLLNSLEK